MLPILAAFLLSADAGTKFSKAEMAEAQEHVRRLEERCGKDAYRIDVGMSFDRAKNCAETTFEVDPKTKVPNATVYRFWDGWSNGYGHVRVKNGKITAVDRPDPSP